jgi:hypothetical protein
MFNCPFNLTITNEHLWNYWIISNNFFFCFRLEGQNKCFTMNFLKGVPTSLKVFYNNLFELILNNIRYRKSMKLTKY